MDSDIAPAIAVTEEPASASRASDTPEITQGEALSSEHGKVYWASAHAWQGTVGFFRRRPVKSILLLVTVLFLIWYARPFYQPYLTEVRIRAFLALLWALIFAVGAWRYVRAPAASLRRAQRKGRDLRWQGAWLRRAAIVLATICPLAVVLLYGSAAQDYVALYWRYQSLKVVTLAEPPVSSYERIQARDSVAQIAQDKNPNYYLLSEPQFVRVGDEYHWTLSRGPGGILGQVWSGAVDGVYDIPGTVPNPDWSRVVNVHFEVGEQMALANHTETCIRRAFGPWRYFNYEPAESRYIKNDAGEWVTAVSLIRWTGFLAPRPASGGVVIVNQDTPSPSSGPGNKWYQPVAGIVNWVIGLGQHLEDNASRALVGCGTWIPPEETQQHAFLRGQNLLPERVSRYIANSFRFQGGFWGPLPGNHYSDIRIPQPTGEVNWQPFVSYLENIPGERGKLYDYFSLEPFDPEKRGTSLMLFVPSDGGTDNIVYAFYPKTGFTGVSAVPRIVQESCQRIDWGHAKPIEERYFARRIGGAVHFYTLTTVVSFDPKSGQLAGGVPQLVLTNQETTNSVWVDPRQPSETWIPQLEKELAGDPGSCLRAGP